MAKQAVNSVTISGYEGVLQSLIALSAGKSINEKRLALGSANEIKVWRMTENGEYEAYNSLWLLKYQTGGWVTEMKIYPHRHTDSRGSSLTLTCLNWFHEPESARLAIAYKEEGILYETHFLMKCAVAYSVLVVSTT